jgi:hypothetical protein
MPQAFQHDGKVSRVSKRSFAVILFIEIKGVGVAFGPDQFIRTLRLITSMMMGRHVILRQATASRLI